MKTYQIHLKNFATGVVTIQALQSNDSITGTLVAAVSQYENYEQTVVGINEFPV